MTTPGLTRRSFVHRVGGLLLAPALGACGVTEPDGRPGNRRLTARPRQPSLEPVIGESALGLGGERDGLLFVPTTYDPATPHPLVVALHGASVDADSMRSFGTAADSLEAVVLIPDSRDRTWDMFNGTFGPDVAFLDEALAYTFDRVVIDASRIALLGFSDGATYSLSVGVSNGDLFTHLIAFSPGGIDRAEPIVGQPQIFVSHGVLDGILPIQASRLEIVPLLRDAGYTVVYREFNGGHAIPNDVAGEALTWFLL